VAIRNTSSRLPDGRLKAFLEKSAWQLKRTM
jgi:hypothetical protein